MARPKSEDKRKAILDAALAMFAERGAWSTPTSAISKAAGVAEGTLFTYFSTKEILLNELFRALKMELANALLATFPAGADVRTRLHHLWKHYVQWGVINSDKLKVLAQLQVSDQITEESRASGQALYAEIERIGTDIAANEHMPDYPVPFMSALFESMAVATVAAIARDQRTSVDYSTIGFDIFWNGISMR